ncbi:MAG: alpha/beta hydrolase [Planctomycetota bacterium]|jgi:alpha-beta hydrolase superfamily lysophospholipase
MTTPTSWSIPGSGGEPILGNTHEPAAAPRGVVVIAHGFKGYKDYGMFPRIAASCADAGFIAHRFNFSHSGMTNDLATFARPDLFERDTWNRQVEDLRTVVERVHDGTLAGNGLPLVVFGHSRGGVSALLLAGRLAADDTLAPLAGVATAAAPSRCLALLEDDIRRLQEQGYLESPSSRTGQVLRVGRAWLQEQLDEPERHDLHALVGRIRCPLLVIHGTDDPTVPVACASELEQVATAPVRVLRIEGANHVFNTPNPLPADEPSSPELQQLLDALCEFVSSVCVTN